METQSTRYFEIVREHIEGEGVANSWSTVDAKVRETSVYLLENILKLSVLRMKLRVRLIVVGRVKRGKEDL